MGNESKHRVLRLGIIQNGKIVEERLFRKRDEISIGQASRNTFIVPEAKIPKSYTLFENRGGQYVLVFERRMTGRVSSGDEIHDLKQLGKSGDVERKGSYCYLPLSEESRGKVVIGDITILFQFVDAPQILPKTQLPAAARAGLASRIDWTFTYILVLSGILLGGGGIGSDIWWRQTGQYLEMQYESRKARTYEILKAEVKTTEEEKKKEEEKQEETKEEVPEATSTAEEDKPVEKKRKPRRRTGATKRRTKTTKGSASERARKKTFLHVLGSDSKGGSLLANTLKGGVSSDKIAKAFDGIGSTDGVGMADGTERGPDLAPEVKGGTGSYKGLTGKDVGGKRIVTKRVNTKKSTTERRVRARVGAGRLSGQTGSGKIDKASVARVFRRRKGAIKYCYEKALKTNGRLKGKVGIRFKIGTAGRITSISVTTNTTGSAGVGNCIKGKVRTWRFPPAEGGSVTFSHTFVLST